MDKPHATAWGFFFVAPSQASSAHAGRSGMLQRTMKQKAGVFDTSAGVHRRVRILADKVAIGHQH